MADEPLLRRARALAWRLLGRRIDRDLLARTMSEPMSDRASAVPFDSTLPLPSASLELIYHLLISAVLFVTGWLEFGISPSRLVVALLVAGSALMVVSALLRGGLNPVRRIEINGAGVLVRTVFTTRTIPWWALRRVLAAPDISTIVLESEGGRIELLLDRVHAVKRAAIVNAVRARVPAGVEIAALPAARFTRRFFANSLSGLAGLVFVASFYLVPLAGGSLGIRCSGPSSYFDKRFGLPPQERGCVVLRVSGSAKRGGVRQGDRMIAMNGAPITSGTQFNDRFLDEADSSFDFTFVRAGLVEPVKVTIRLGGSPTPDAPKDDPLTWFLLARGNSNRAEAIEQYSKAIELAPDFDLAYLFRSELEASRIGLTPEGLADLQMAVDLNPELAEAYRDLALNISGHIFIGAEVPISYAQRSIQLDQCAGGFVKVNWDCARDYSVLAAVLRFRADVPGSIQAADQALQYYPKSTGPLYQLAMSYEAQDDRNQAVAYARRFLASGAADRKSAEVDDMGALIARIHGKR